MSAIDNVQDAIHSWFSTATGLTTVWSNQNVEHPPYPYGLLTLISFGDNVQSYDCIETNPFNQTMDIVGLRMCSIGCEVRGQDRNVSRYAALASDSLNDPFTSDIFAKRQITEIAVSTVASGAYTISLYGVTASYTAGVLDTATTIRDGLYASLLSTVTLLNRNFTFAKSGSNKLTISWRIGFIFGVAVSSNLSSSETAAAVSISRINEDDISVVPEKFENGWINVSRFDAHFYYLTNTMKLAVPMVEEIHGTINGVEYEIL